MSSVNPLTREILLKIVYCGPGLGGKTTTLKYIHQTARPEHRGKMVSLATPVDRTLYFDFLPIRLSKVGGYTLRLQLFTVPGQVHYNATRKLVLTGADGVVMVIDSQTSRMDANIESLENLGDNLAEREIDVEDFPFIFQYNKRDLNNIIPVSQLEDELNPQAKRRFVETCAITGEGVYRGLEMITKEVLKDLKRRDILAQQKTEPSKKLERKIAFSQEKQGISQTVQRLSEDSRPLRGTRPPPAPRFLDDVAEEQHTPPPERTSDKPQAPPFAEVINQPEPANGQFTPFSSIPSPSPATGDATTNGRSPSPPPPSYLGDRGDKPTRPAQLFGLEEMASLTERPEDEAVTALPEGPLEQQLSFSESPAPPTKKKRSSRSASTPLEASLEASMENQAVAEAHRREQTQPTGAARYTRGHGNKGQRNNETTLSYRRNNTELATLLEPPELTQPTEVASKLERAASSFSTGSDEPNATTQVINVDELKKKKPTAPPMTGNASDPSFSFSPLWPSADRPSALAIEQAMADGRDREAMQLIWQALEAKIASVGEGLPDQSPVNIVSLLGLDGRQYLKIAKVARLNRDGSPGQVVGRPVLLKAYLFLIQAISASGS